MRPRFLLAVFLGGLFDVVATNIVSLPIVIVVLMQINLRSTPPDRLSHELTERLHGSPLLFGASILAGSLCSIAGGYLAARIAREREALSGALACWLCVGLSVWSLFKGIESGSPWLHALSFALSPLLGLLGGHLRLQQLRRAPTTPAMSSTAP